MIIILFDITMKLKFVCLFFLVLFLFGCSSYSSERTLETIESNKEIPTYELYEQISINDLTFTVDDVMRLKEVGDALSTVKTEGDFVVVLFTVENKGKVQRDVLGSEFKFVDEQGRIFETSNSYGATGGISGTPALKDRGYNGTGISWITIRPGFKEKIVVAIEVPAGVTGKLILNDEAYIKVPKSKLSEPTTSADIEITNIEFRWSERSNTGFLNKIDFQINNTGETPIRLGIDYKIFEIVDTNDETPLIISGNDEVFSLVNDFKSGDINATYYAPLSFLLKTFKPGLYKFQLNFIDSYTSKLLATIEKEQKTPE